MKTANCDTSPCFPFWVVRIVAFCGFGFVAPGVRCEDKPVAVQSAEARSVADEKELASYRSTIETLDSSNETKSLVAAMETLRKSYPKCRPVLLEGLKSSSIKLKCFALQLIGEQGTAAEDLEVVAQSLKDAKPRVRLAAVMALRRLGREGFKALCEYLPAETDSNNRKMAIKSFQTWNATEAVPLLVELLEKEKEKTVRNFTVTALEVLTERKLGDNLGAWKTYLEGQRMSEQAKGLNDLRTKNLVKEKP